MMTRLLSLIILTLLLTTCRKQASDPAPPPPPPYTPIKLESSSFTIGNLERGILDTFVLHYNKPVAVNHILLISDICLPSLERTISADGKTIKFYKLLCGRLGEDFSFQVSVRDGEGRTKIDTVRFNYYTRRMPIEGRIMHYMVTSDNQYCWLTTQEPNRLYCLGIEDSTFKKVFDLPFLPGRFDLNPFNQKLYVLPYFTPQNNRNRVYVIDPANGNILKTVTVEKDSYDDPQKNIVVYDVSFGANGYGLLNTGMIETSPSRWRVMDSRQNDTIYAHPQWIAAVGGSGNYNFRELFNFKKNHNKTRIYMSQQYSAPRGAYLDCTTGVVTELFYPSFSPNHYVVPSKTQEKLFVAGYLFQGIYENGSFGNYSEFDNRYSETADFSYRPNENNFMYYRSKDDSYELLILDYDNARVLMRTNVPPVFNKIHATTNGKYLVAEGKGGLYLYETDLFYKHI
jgi:hypothetical protein